MLYGFNHFREVCYFIRWFLSCEGSLTNRDMAKNDESHDWILGKMIITLMGLNGASLLMNFIPQDKCNLFKLV